MQSPCNCLLNYEIEIKMLMKSVELYEHDEEQMHLLGILDL